MRVQQLRIAWETRDLARVVAFYCDVLRATIVSRFADHDGFSGAMLSIGSGAYHFEFTQRTADASTTGRGDRDDLIALYIDSSAEWDALLARIARCGAPVVAARNPYWDRHGVTVADPDGRRVVFFRGAWDAQIGAVPRQARDDTSAG